MAKYECFVSEGFSETSIDWHGVNVGNTTVNCNVTWVLSWLPHADIRPVFSTKPIWFENPSPIDQTSNNITMTMPNNQFVGAQSTAIADSYWMCDNDTLLNNLPDRWIGLCTSSKYVKKHIYFFYFTVFLQSV